MHRVAYGEQEYLALYDAEGRLIAERVITRGGVAEFAPTHRDTHGAAPPRAPLPPSEAQESGIMAGLATLVMILLCAALALGLLGLGAFVGYVFGDGRGAGIGSLTALFILGWLLAPADRNR